MSKIKNCWLPNELDILKQNYCFRDKNNLTSILPRHSWNSIKDKARVLGLVHHGVYNNTKICTKCKKILPVDNFKFQKSHILTGLTSWCIHCIKIHSRHKYALNIKSEQKRGRDKYAQLRKEILVKYGGVCSCCSESETSFLAIDHINNDGAAHRRKFTSAQGGLHTYLWLKRNNYPSGFQVLCHNCNWSKHVNGGECAHKTKN